VGGSPRFPPEFAEHSLPLPDRCLSPRSRWAFVDASAALVFQLSEAVYVSVVPTSLHGTPCMCCATHDEEVSRIGSAAFAKRDIVRVALARFSGLEGHARHAIKAGARDLDTMLGMLQALRAGGL
jgi:hypothetical protein